MKKVNKFLCTLLVIIMCLTSLTVGTFANASGRYDSGQCGESVSWELDKSTGTLTISGVGEVVHNNNYHYWTSSQVKKVVIGSYITGITDPQLGLCENLSYVEVKEDNGYLTSVDGVLFSRDMKKLYVYPAKKSGSSYTVPYGVETIVNHAFNCCKNLKTISMPDTLSHIRYCAFMNCTALTSINIPYTVTSVSGMAFYNCSQLTSIVLPYDVETIGDFAFGNCKNLLSLTIPESVTEIGKCAVGYDSNYNRISNPTIYGVSGSLAESYADDYNFSFSPVAAHVHDWICGVVESTCYSAGYERSFCTRCITENYVYLPLEDHSFGEWNVTKRATCKTTGTRVKKCTVCGTEETETIPKQQHKLSDWEVQEEATCNSEGIEMRFCDTCSKYESRTIPKLTHVFSDWSETKEATVICGGEMTKTCTLCGKKETKATDKLPSNETKDEKTGISLVFSDESFKNNSVEITAEEVSSGEKYNIAIEETSCSRLQLFDISLEIENEKVQPNNSVWVKVPLPKGYNESKTAVYYVGEDGKLEKMNSVVQDGYICFEATHFSPYAVVDESSNPNNCTCDCHKGGIKGFLFKILNFFQKLFGQNKVCTCGVKH